MLHEVQLFKLYWREVITYVAYICVAYLQNQSFTKAIFFHTNSFELWYKKNPNLVYLCIFINCYYVKIWNPLRIKVDAKSQAYIFLGFSLISKGYKFQLVTTKAIFVSRCYDAKLLIDERMKKYHIFEDLISNIL
uniref:Retroviral polymerase SH3-like domain-containing protein n=1 Tax=Physcomitrium patens TaxID=3218 RepID=A0A2K1JYG6_PHYPA|nr:hypothetical protein PHYPA_013693 [Physcomitrium patens]